MSLILKGKLLAGFLVSVSDWFENEIPVTTLHKICLQNYNFCSMFLPLKGRNICLEKHCKAMVNSYNTTLKPGWPITKGFISSQLDCIVVKWHIVLPRL